MDNIGYLHFQKVLDNGHTNNAPHYVSSILVVRILFLVAICSQN